MKKIIIIINILIVALFSSQSLTSSENYIYSRTYLEPVTTDNTTAKQIQSVEYFDGLGRSKQSIAIKASPTGKDIVVPSVYDNDGRQTKNYLPLPIDSQNGAYLPNVTENTINSYYGVSNAYSEVLLEKSPLARTEKAAAPGTDWQINGTHAQKTEYQSNTGGLVKRYKATTAWNSSTQINDVSIALAPDDNYTTGGYYNANTLYKWVTTDEDGNETHTYTNSVKQKILVRQINKKPEGSSENLDTYYVYDEFGNLSYIIPPKASVSAISTSVLDKLCYQYKYDQYNRQVEKKLPGKDWVYVVYDKQNRLVGAQDGNLRAKGQWIYNKYDKFGRIAITGISTGNTRSNEQALADQKGLNNVNRIDYVYYNRQGMDVYYDNPEGTYPISPNWVSLLSVNYYDTYPVGSPSQPAQIQNQVTLTSTPTTFTSNGWSSVRSIQTLPTASHIKNVENDSWSSAFIWYDTLGRAIGTYGKNPLGGFTRTESVLDFSGKTNEVYTYHSRNTSVTEVTVKDRYVYTPQNYLSKHYQQINSNAEELLTEYTYNDLGQVVNKKIGNNIQSIDFTYNIRGWLTGINPNDITNLGNKLFAYRIKYNAIEGTETPNNEYTNLKVKPKYNGSIAEVDWKTAHGTNEPLRRYGYVYDGVNRMRAGFFQGESNPYTKEYSEITDYDLNGNISRLTRTGGLVNTVAEVMDDLRYTYDGNQLSYMEETGSGNALSGYPLPQGVGNNITYDGNGNMTKHLDKGFINIDYNFLNLPSRITHGIKQNTISYVYAANGNKVHMLKGSEITDYLGNFQYTTLDGVLSSQVLANEEGYFDFVNNRYVYQYRDHLGNIRISYTKDNNGNALALEENNYYPFGMKHTGYNTGDTTNNKFKYLYNSKELQSNGNLDYGWRQYMPDLGRWNGMDQLSEAYHAASPYAYVMNNPINMFDPDGRLTQAQIDYMWNNSGQGYTTWTFNPDGSPRMKSYSYMDSSLVQSVLSAVYAAADNSNGIGGGGGGLGGFGTSGFAGSFGGGGGMGSGGFGGSNGGYTKISFWTDGTLYPNEDGYQSIQELINWNIKIYNQNFDNNVNWYGPGGKGNWFFGTSATTIGYVEGSFRMTNGAYNGSAWSPKYYPSGWTGGSRARISTYNISKIGKGLGTASFFLGLAFDGVGVWNYTQNPKSDNAVHPGKAALNTGMGYLGWKGGAPGAIIATLYFGIDNFYPGGWVGASETAARTEAHEQQTTGHPFFSNSAIKF